MPEFILALDCGTTSVKALITSPDGTPRAVARRPIVSHFPAPGLVEQDAALVWSLCCDVMAEALSTASITAHDLAAVLEALREPVESGEMRITRKGQTRVWPARFQLLATTNLCPCGRLRPGRVQSGRGARGAAFG